MNMDSGLKSGTPPPVKAWQASLFPNFKSQFGQAQAARRPSNSSGKLQKSQNITRPGRVVKPTCKLDSPNASERRKSLNSANHLPILGSNVDRASHTPKRVANAKSKATGLIDFDRPLNWQYYSPGSQSDVSMTPMTGMSKPPGHGSDGSVAPSRTIGDQQIQSFSPTAHFLSNIPPTHFPNGIDHFPAISGSVPRESAPICALDFTAFSPDYFASFDSHGMESYGLADPNRENAAQSFGPYYGMTPDSSVCSRNEFSVSQTLPQSQSSFYSSPSVQNAVEGDELVGMGLYDHREPASKRLSSCDSFISSSTSSEVGKGLRLEEAWEPPQPDNMSEKGNMDAWFPFPTNEDFSSYLPTNFPTDDGTMAFTGLQDGTTDLLYRGMFSEEDFNFDPALFTLPAEKQWTPYDIPAEHPNPHSDGDICTLF